MSEKRSRKFFECINDFSKKAILWLKKKFFHMKETFLFVIIILVFLGLLYLIKEIVMNESDFEKIITTIAPLVTSFAAIVNLLVALYLFRGKDRKENKSYWFKKIILENNCEHIDKYFHDSLELIKKTANIVKSSKKNRQDEYNKIFEAYTDLRIELISSLADMCSVIDVNFGEDILKILDGFQDETTQAIADLIEGAKIDFMKEKKMILNQKKTLMSELYKVYYEI